MGVVISATGNHVTKAVTVAEIVKRLCPVSSLLTCIYHVLVFQASYVAPPLVCIADVANCSVCSQAVLVVTRSSRAK